MQIFAHPSLQNSACWERLEGRLACTNFFRSRHNISIELRSGLWLGQSRVWILFLWSHSCVGLLECFGSLSCWIIHFHPSFSSLTDGRRFWSRICWYAREFMVPWSRPGPEAEKQPQTFTFPPPCFTVGRRLFSSYVVLAFFQAWWFWLWPNNSILDLSVQRMDFQKASGLSKCSLAKLKQAALLFFESRGFLLATLPWIPWLFNFIGLLKWLIKHPNVFHLSLLPAWINQRSWGFTYFCTYTNSMFHVVFGLLKQVPLNKHMQLINIYLTVHT